MSSYTVVDVVLEKPDYKLDQGVDIKPVTNLIGENKPVKPKPTFDPPEDILITFYDGNRHT